MVSTHAGGMEVVALTQKQKPMPLSKELPEEGSAGAQSTPLHDKSFKVLGNSSANREVVHYAGGPHACAKSLAKKIAIND